MQTTTTCCIMGTKHTDINKLAFSPFDTFQTRKKSQQQHRISVAVLFLVLWKMCKLNLILRAHIIWKANNFRRLKSVDASHHEVFECGELFVCCSRWLLPRLMFISLHTRAFDVTLMLARTRREPLVNRVRYHFLFLFNYFASSSFLFSCNCTTDHLIILLHFTALRRALWRAQQV